MHKHKKMGTCYSLDCIHPHATRAKLLGGTLRGHVDGRFWAAVADALVGRHGANRGSVHDDAFGLLQMVNGQVHHADGALQV